MKTLKTTNGNHEVILDDEDFEIYSKVNWQYKPTSIGRTVYAGGGRKNPKHINISLAREIMKCPSGLVVDHINRNILDNRKENLRVVTQAENCKNRRKKRIDGYKWLRGL